MKKMPLQQPLAINSVEKLATYLQLDIKKLGYSPQANDQFRFTVPISFMQRMKKGDYYDPLLLQVLPHNKELIETNGFSNDPLDEKSSVLSSGLLQKYQHRVLLIVTSSCAIHCRYCFRRHFPYSNTDKKNQLSEQLEKNIQLIKTKYDITEVILSGGDPLTLNDQRFHLLLEQLASITHLKRLRIHSRQLIVEPKRITQKLVNMLNTFPRPIAIVLHINHPAEINQEVIDSIGQLKQKNIQLLNQSVLLQGINDNSDILIQLSEQLFQAGILPYYLHLLDEVNGSSHFMVTIEKAKVLMEKMKIKLPGYLVPKLVKEFPDDQYKQQV